MGSYSELEQHIVRVRNEPSTLLDASLLASVGPLISQQSPKENTRLVSNILQTLPTLQQEPTVLNRLLLQILGPWSFSDILALDPPPDLAQGLDLSSLPFNGLTLSILEKAALTSADAAHVASSPTVTYQLVKLWLFTTETGIAEHAARVLKGLLLADKGQSDDALQEVCDSHATSYQRGQGLMWRRLFRDRRIYELLYVACDLRESTDLSRSSHDKSLSQARLMSFAVELGRLDWSYLIKSHIPDIERAHGLDPDSEGLLDFIACIMCNTTEDILMNVCLLEFLSELIIRAQRTSGRADHSVALEYLKKKGLHDRTMSVWLSPNDPAHDPIAVNYTYGPSARYVAVFARTFPQAFLEDSRKARHILIRLWTAFNRFTSAQWSQGQSSKHDLEVLASLPRVVLLPQRFLGNGRLSSPLLQIPVHATNVDALNCLAWIFQGPKRVLEDQNGDDIEDQAVVAEAAAARAVYVLYIRNNNDLFKHLVGHAETIALPDVALAALNVIASIANARWSPLPKTEGNYDDSQFPARASDLPTEESLRFLCPQSVEIPADIGGSGIIALTQAPARGYLFPYLMRPAQKFSNLIGGRGDPEDAAYKVAMAKWDVLQLVVDKLRESETVSSMNQYEHSTLIKAMEARISQGPWGAMSGLGGQVASLEL